MNQEGIFAIKFGELERQYEETLERLRRCRDGEAGTVRRERREVQAQCLEAERSLQGEVDHSRSPAVAALSAAQLDYSRRAQRLLREELPRCLGEGDPSAGEVEAVSLYGEYAVDFAIQGMRYALLVVLSAMEAQLDEQGKGSR